MLLFHFSATAHTEKEKDAVYLTAEEQAWINAHPIIRLARNQHFEPRAYLDENGVLKGISVEFARLFENLKNKLEAETAYLQEEILLEHDFEGFIGQTPAIQYVLYKVEQVAATDASVLVFGETGTGKSTFTLLTGGIISPLMVNYLEMSFRLIAISVISSAVGFFFLAVLLI